MSRTFNGITKGYQGLKPNSWNRTLIKNVHTFQTKISNQTSSTHSNSQIWSHVADPQTRKKIMCKPAPAVDRQQTMNMHCELRGSCGPEHVYHLQISGKLDPFFSRRWIAHRSFRPGSTSGVPKRKAAVMLKLVLGSWRISQRKFCHPALEALLCVRCCFLQRLS